MTDETKLALDQSRGMRAERLLKDELLVEAFSTLEADYTAAWKKTGVRDTDGRERLWQAIQIVGKVRDHLTAVVSNGKLAATELKQIETLGERRKILGIV